MDRKLLVVFGIVCALSLAACGAGGTKPPADGDVVADGDGDEEMETASDGDAEPDREAEAEESEPVFNPEAAAAGFKLYYRERVDRVVTAFNRYQLFGDAAFGVTIGKAGVAISGEEIEIVPGPNDNNMIGLSAWNAWQAYKIFHSRALALSLVRMFNGLAFLEGVSGHPGLTARNAYPGWTLAIDGRSGDVSRTVDGTVITPPVDYAPSLEAEIIAAFFGGGRFTYRENPADFMFDYMPAVEVGPYATTYSFSMLPRYIRVSDCCTSLMRTPAPYEWEGAFWSNHNSRDNFPDLAIGYLAALAAKSDPDAAPEVREAAERAWASGRRVGDSIQTHEGRLMTVDEHNPYDTLVVAGAVRPDGETESEDLGSLSSCQDAFLGRALSSDGLGLPPPGLPLPGSIEFLMEGLFDECHASESVRLCRRLQEAYCGYDWDEMTELHLFGHKWLEYIGEMEENSPGTAEKLIGSFQDDYYEVSLASVALADYAETVGDRELAAQARGVVGDMTELMRIFADLIYSQTAPERQVSRRYEAALFDAMAGRAPIAADLNGFARAEAQMASLESLLTLGDSAPAPLLTDEEILSQSEAYLSSRSDSVKARYREAYGETPPLRVAGEGYEARYFHPDEEMQWRPVGRPQHHFVHGQRLLEAVSFCTRATSWLDCSWAALGCARPDLDGGRAVDEADEALFAAAQGTHGQAVCREDNRWCDGADLDHSGASDETDAAFMAAAVGCWY
ncbi:MAG: hypothetical protein C4523_07295 [Myxococcales bacterium]|nr:MAG: hypothetical protein C4523_07295 [Myxococcales bacterium]